MVRILASFCLALCAALASAKCMSQQTVRVRSLDGAHLLILQPDGRFELDGKKAAAAIAGHHWEVFLSAGGSFFVVVDPYVGIMAFDSKGRTIRQIPAESLCRARTGAWACHPEGRWFEGNARLLKSGDVKCDVGVGSDIEIKFGKNGIEIVPAPIDRFPLYMGAAFVFAVIVAFSSRKGGSFRPLARS